ncbi:MAG: cyclopropane-fatty-acyl-phospholipid synthase family protein [Pirellulaceae bacterium]
MMTGQLTQWGISAVERGWVPDLATRYAMRRLCERRIADVAVQDHAQGVAAFAAAARNAPIAPVPQRANEQHYEVPAAFYEHVLGRRRKYSCCLWSPGVADLHAAEEAALAQTCEHAELADGHNILELGCGWGSLSLWILERYPRCRVTAVSNSASQRRYVEAAAARAGVSDRLHVVTADMNDFTIDRQFDRVVSVEMFEHMRNYEELLRRIRGWLRADGKLFVHVFCHQRFAYTFVDERASDWMSRYFFTGGIMPSEDLICHFANDLHVVRLWRWNGTHYQRTANAWVDRLDQNRTALLPILGSIYGADQAARWWQRWRMLFMAGAELFGYRQGNEWFVAHYLLERT